MDKRELLIKLTFTFFCVALIIGLTLMIIFNNIMGMLIELVAVIIFLIVIVWTS